MDWMLDYLDVCASNIFSINANIYNYSRTPLTQNLITTITITIFFNKTSIQNNGFS